MRLATMKKWGHASAAKNGLIKVLLGYPNLVAADNGAKGSRHLA
jgi:hypothetical protein